MRDEFYKWSSRGEEAKRLDDAFIEAINVFKSLPPEERKRWDLACRKLLKKYDLMDEMPPSFPGRLDR